MRTSLGLRYLLPLVATVLLGGLVAGQDNSKSATSESEFHRGYYLQHETNDISNAVKAYKQAIALGGSAKIRAAVDAQMAELQEELATADFARIMPADAIGYLEISSPALHVERIAQVMGLTGKSFSANDDKVTIRIEDGLAISSNFQISPALLREFKKIRGAAFAVTDIRQTDPPFEGIAVIHPGDSDLIGGILETGVQLVTATESIGGYPTFSVENKVWIVKTKRLVIVSTSKKSIETCLNQVSNQNADSLAKVEGFKAARAENQDAAVFAYLSPEKVVAKFEPMMQHELSIARMVLDLDHMQYITAAFMATDQGVRSRVHVKFAEDHKSFGYGLIRTVPLTRNALKHVPSGAAGVVGMGLNPRMLLAAQAAGTTQQLSALDIGREFFANIEEVGMFVLPSITSESLDIPNVGLVIASSDIEKSDLLWNQLLSLPSMLDMEDGPTAKTIAIDGVEAREYTFSGKEIPRLVIARLGDEALVAGTHKAVEAVVKARKSGATLANDDRAVAFWNSTSEHTSKAAFVNVGRALRLAASMNGGRDAEEMNMVADVIQDLMVTLIVNEAPADFEVQLDVAGLPQFDSIIKAFAKFQPNVAKRFDRAYEPAIQSSVSDRATHESDAAIEIRD